MFWNPVDNARETCALRNSAHLIVPVVKIISEIIKLVEQGHSCGAAPSYSQELVTAAHPEAN